MEDIVDSKALGSWTSGPVSTVTHIDIKFQDPKSGGTSLWEHMEEKRRESQESELKLLGTRTESSSFKLGNFPRLERIFLFTSSL